MAHKIPVTHLGLGDAVNPRIGQIFHDLDDNNLYIYRDGAFHLISAESAGEANTASNAGAGVGIFKEKDGVDLIFKSLKAGSNVTLTPGTDEITIASTASGGSSVLSWKNFVTDYGGVGDGSTDNATALANAIQDCNDNGYILYIPAGTYIVDSGIYLTMLDHVILIGDGIGKTIIKTSGDTGITTPADLIKLNGRDDDKEPADKFMNLYIYGITFQNGIGQTGSYTTKSALNLCCVNDSHIENCEFISAGDGFSCYYSKNVIFTHNICHNYTRTGAKFSNIDHCIVSNNLVYDIKSTSEPNVYGITMTYSNLDVGLPLGVHHGTMAHNVIIGNGRWEAFSTHGLKYCSIIGNTIHNFASGFSIDANATGDPEIRYNIIANNVLSGGGSGFAYYFAGTNCDHNYLFGNIFNGYTGSNIEGDSTNIKESNQFWT